MVFIIGSGRSGTTLFRAMLWAGEISACPPETYGLKRAVIHFALHNYKSWDILCREFIDIIRFHGDVNETWEVDFDIIYDKALKLSVSNRTAYGLTRLLYRDYQEQHGVNFPYWGDKTPNNTIGIFWIIRAFEGVRFIHLARHGLNVANSYKNSGLETHNSIKSGLHRWLTAVGIVRKIESSKKYNLLTVKYEDLTNSPEENMKRVYDYCQLSYQTSWQNHMTIFDQMGDASLYSHHENVQNEISDVVKSQLQRNPLEGEEYLPKISSTLKYLGYL